jgi:hypothetical protein
MALGLNAASVSSKDKADYLNDIKNLIVATQKTRGGTYNFLNGNEFAQFGVYEERTKIKNYIRTLRQKSKVTIPSIDKEFDTLKKQLRSTNKMAFKLDPLIAFKAYSTLIEKMISIGKQAQQAFYSNSGELNEKVSHLMMYTIIPLTDGLGKLRGLGSGIIARTECEEEEVELMESYIDEIHTHLKKLDHDLTLLGKKYPKLYPKDLFKKYNKYDGEIKSYIKFAKSKLIDKSDIDEDSNKYFAEGTHLIKSTTEFFKINKQILVN